MKFLRLILLLMVTVQAQAFSLPNETPIRPYECLSCINLSHEFLSTSWVTKNTLLGHQTLHKQTSRKYQMNTNLNELHQGVAIYTEAPGAVVRLSPVNPNQSIKPELRIKNSLQNTTLSLIEASSQYTQGESLKSAALTENTIAFAKLKPELGAGKFIISSPTRASAKSTEVPDYIIQVYDQNSPTYLSIETDKAYYRYGDTLTAVIILRDNQLKYPVENIKVTLINPNKEKTLLDVQPLSSTMFKVQASLNSERNTLGENWYIEASASAISENRTIYRQAHTSISYAIPSAAVKEIERTNIKIAVVNDKNSSITAYSFNAKIDVATDSRYALEAVLYGTDKKGNIKAMQIAQSAAWLTVGENTLSFSFDPNVQTAYKAPYYLGYIHLTDYGQNKPVYNYDTLIELTQLG